MSQLKPRIPWLALLSFFLSIAMAAPAIQAQTGESASELKKRVSGLMEQTKYTEALPLLEKIATLEPKDGETQFYLGFALLGQANNAKDAMRKALRVRARNSFIKSKQLGFNEPRLDALIMSLPEDGSDAPSYSGNPKADELMQAGEAFFSQGKADEALKKYQQALELDSKLYHAALYSGDIYLQKQDFAQAEYWYQKAIAIDPTKETAYRYSATPLMKQGKTDAARDRYVEAFITEPYNRFAVAGLVQWGRATKTTLAHPEIDIPTNVSFDEKGNAKVNLDASALIGKDNGSFAWLSYGVTRTNWRKEKFAKTFPSEKTYRHTLAEEVDALQSVISTAMSDKSIKTLSPSLATLKKLNDEGLLEAYLLIARPDQGIAQDHPAYLKQNREKLRRYVIEYVVKGSKN
ncbi:MAG TPA: tetratricopeptide repeat protein [Pyrinomonadaceae bacterium]|nr:tetratricopeptide repeat protein [Pyrinomonadaceae bacterium]